MYALNWTRLSCDRFVVNQMRRWLFVLAYNLGNVMRRAVLPKVAKDWSLRSLQLRWRCPKTCLPPSLERIARLCPAPG